MVTPRATVSTGYLVRGGGNVAQASCVSFAKASSSTTDDRAARSRNQARVLRLAIHEGRNRQVRRMCEAIGHPVNRLVRVRIGTLRDATLGPGEWRVLTLSEIKDLIESVGAAGSQLR